MSAAATSGRAQAGLDPRSWLRDDAFAGVTVALVTIPKAMAFATIAGLPPVTGIYAAVVMELASSAFSRSPSLVVGPSITASSLTFAVLSTVLPHQPQSWPAAAGALAVLVGLFTVLGAVLDIGRFLRFISRSVIVGLMVGSALLIFGSQLPSALGLPAPRDPMLVRILWQTAGSLTAASPAAMLMAGGTLAAVVLFGLLGKRFPAAFAALLAGGIVQAALSAAGYQTGLQSISALPWRWPTSLTPRYDGPLTSDMVVGAAALALVGMIQTLTIAKALAQRADVAIRPRRELLAVGFANAAAGLLHGFPGSGSFARSALSELAGARTKASSIVSAVAMVAIVSAGAPLTTHLTGAAIAGLLLATVTSMVDWREFVHVMRRDRDDRIVLGTTIACVFVLPIHWAILIGLVMSIVMLLRRVSRLYLFEMVRSDDGPFREHELDERTGRSAITMLQIEGPLFFAHADILAARLRQIFSRGPRATVLRMRRTQQIDFSVIAALEPVVREYLESGGHLVVCGLSPAMRDLLWDSPLGRTIGADFLLETSREVFGSAHMALGLAQSIVDVTPQPGRERFRSESPAEPRQPDPVLAAQVAKK